MIEVVVTDEFVAWLGGLSEGDQDAVIRAVNMLEMSGVALGFPMSSAVNGSRIALRELRIQSGGKPLRAFYVFDPARQAVMLLGGDKTGDKRFYEVMIRECERIWADYLEETGL